MSQALIVHVIHRLGIGGLENGLVNLINHLPREKYGHAIVCLTEAGGFEKRLKRDDVPVYALHKREGQDLGLYFRFYGLLRQLRPAIVHTRNLAAIECQLPAWMAGVPGRIHGEHGWDVFDPDGRRRKYQWLRRAFRPLVQRYIPLSRQLESYLTDRIGVPQDKITRICNGVDTQLFHPSPSGKEPIPGCPFQDQNLVLIGTVGRMHGVKDQITLVKAFIRLLARHPELRQTVRLVCIGEGPLRHSSIHALEQEGLQDLAWLPGERDDISRVLRGLDVFVLPSRAEGISNTLLEAMATALPVLATAVGGNGELVNHEETGFLVPAGDYEAMATHLYRYASDGRLRRQHGERGWVRVREEFSLERMLDRYDGVYSQLLENNH